MSQRGMSERHPICECRRESMRREARGYVWRGLWRGLQRALRVQARARVRARRAAAERWARMLLCIRTFMASISIVWLLATATQRAPASGGA